MEQQSLSLGSGPGAATTGSPRPEPKQLNAHASADDQLTERYSAAVGALVEDAHKLGKVRDRKSVV